MNEVQSKISAAVNDGTGRQTGEEFLEKFAAAFARTDEFRRIVQALAPQAVGVWAGKSRIKKAIAGPVAKSIEKGFSANGSGIDTAPVAELLSDPKFLSSASKELPLLINGVLARHSFRHRGGGIASR